MIVEDPVALFFFAHQDDEFGVFQQIVDEQRKGRRVFCTYLTDGATRTATSVRRNSESLAVLKQLGICVHDVLFAGCGLSIPDAGLPAQLEKAGCWIDKWFNGFRNIKSVYVPAWEGGHHDHDTLHAVVVALASRKGLLHNVCQFPLYNGFGCKGPLFRIFKPIPANGAVERRRISWGNRFRFLKYCLSYPSQRKTWLGLFPFVLIFYLRTGAQTLQPVSVARIKERPHSGALYYERRNFFSWEKMEACLSTWYLKIGLQK